MPLIIEDGTGVAGADSFETVAECEAFALAYFGASLTGSPASKEAALRRAFVFMSGLRWKADLWPTFEGSIPQAIKNGQSVFARVEFQTSGFLSPNVNLSQAKVLTKVGSLGWTAKDGDNTVEAARPVVTMGLDFIRPWLEYDPSRDGSIGFTGIMAV
jgi:hypothetical protein